MIVTQLLEYFCYYKGSLWKNFMARFYIYLERKLFDHFYWKVHSRNFFSGEKKKPKKSRKSRENFPNSSTDQISTTFSSFFLIFLSSSDDFILFRILVKIISLKRARSNRKGKNWALLLKMGKIGFDPSTVGKEAWQNDLDKLKKREKNAWKSKRAK